MNDAKPDVASLPAKCGTSGCDPAVCQCAGCDPDFSRKLLDDSLATTEQPKCPECDKWLTGYCNSCAAKLDEQPGSADELIRLRELAAACYAGLVAECNLPEKWADVFLSASTGEPFSTEGLLPFTTRSSVQGEAVELGRLRVSPSGDFMGVDWNRPVTLTNGQPIYTTPPPAPLPNAETLQAIDDSYKGRTKKFATVADMLADAEADTDTGMVLTDEMNEAVELTKCCGREECGGECGNEWRGMEWVRKAQPESVRVDEAMVERALRAPLGNYNVSSFIPLKSPTNVRDLMHAALTAALAPDGGEGE